MGFNSGFKGLTHRGSKSDRVARSGSLFRLHYPADIKGYINTITEVSLSSTLSRLLHLSSARLLHCRRSVRMFSGKRNGSAFATFHWIRPDSVTVSFRSL